VANTFSLFSHSQIKIIDFGLAQKLEPNKQIRVLFGTPEFIPPEVINYEPIGLQSDMWSGKLCKPASKQSLLRNA